MADTTRRRLFGSAVSAAALSLLPSSVQRAVAAAPVRRASLGDIQHLVLPMQAGRSFDHHFGTLKSVRGFADPDALKLPNGRSVFHQPDARNPAGYLLPLHLDTRKTSAQAIPSISQVQHQAWNAGKMDQWMPAHHTADGANAT